MTERENSVPGKEHPVGSAAGDDPPVALPRKPTKQNTIENFVKSEIERLNTPVEGKPLNMKKTSKKAKCPAVKNNGTIFKKKKETNFTPKGEGAGGTPALDFGSSPILKLRPEKSQAKKTWDISASSLTSPQMAGQSEPNQTSSKPPCGTTLGLGWWV